MWLSNIKDWTRLAVYDLLDSTEDRTHWRKVVAVHLNDRLDQGHDDNDDRPIITARVFPLGRLFRGRFDFSIRTIANGYITLFVVIVFAVFTCSFRMLCLQQAITRLPHTQQLRWQRTRKLFAYRESTLRI